MSDRLPLGLRAQPVGARHPADLGQRATRKRQPVAETESQKGLTRVEAVLETQAHGPQTHFVGVGDREAAVSDLVGQERPSGVDLLVRAAWHRRVDPPERDLWATVAMHPVGATLGVRGPWRGAQPARQATVSVRWCLARLGPPTHRQAEQRPTVAGWVVQAVEAQPSAGCEPLAWVRLTTGAVHTRRAFDSGGSSLRSWFPCGMLRPWSPYTSHPASINSAWSCKGSAR